MDWMLNMKSPGKMKRELKFITTLSFILFTTVLLPLFSEAQIAEKESEYYRITTIPVPEGILIEAGGVTMTQDDKLAIATRRGDVWIVSNPTLSGGVGAKFQKFASGLHEPLGLIFKDGSFYTAQRGELTKLTDNDGDMIADEYTTVYSWPLSSHYHEYSFGPLLMPDGTFMVTGNVAFGNEEWWRGESRVPWRGWAIRISEDGSMKPWATGMRSPAGYGLIDDEFFYTDNQGDWMGSGGLWHVPQGAFLGHPAGLKWSQEEGSPVKLSEEQFFAEIDNRQVKENGVFIKPENIKNEENPNFLYNMKEKLPALQVPAVVLPHGILGISNTEVKVDKTGGKFGPFENQIFIGDQGQSKIMRLVLEKVNGQYQGVAFDFKAGFQSGVLRMEWDSNANLFIGETNRGWGSAGPKNEGIEYLKWTGKTPPEMKTVTAKPDGFEITFTKPMDVKSLKDLDSYVGKSYIYKYHPVYGSPQTNIEPLKIKGVKAAEDGMSVRVVVENLRPYYVHELQLSGVKLNDQEEGLLHSSFYYTLNSIPDGDKLNSSDLSQFRSSATSKKKRVAVKKKAPVKPKKEIAVLSDAEATELLQINTCTACHKKNERVVGPSFVSIAKRKYSNEQIVDLIYNPQPKNWPEYATPMAPMPHVPKDEALKIAAWINSLNRAD